MFKLLLSLAAPFLLAKLREPASKLVGQFTSPTSPTSPTAPVDQTTAIACQRHGIAVAGLQEAEARFYELRNAAPNPSQCEAMAATIRAGRTPREAADQYCRVRFVDNVRVDDCQVPAEARWTGRSG